MKKIISILLATIILSPAYGWYDSGHMISSWIAWQEMTPEAKKEAGRLLLVLKEAEPKISDFITASTWFDEIKHNGLEFTKYWHAVSQTNLLSENRHPAKTQDGVWLVKEAVKTLSDSKSSDFAKAFMLRALIHVSQDLHQPLHICIDDQKPEYNSCGRAFKIQSIKYGKEQLRNLHALWDSGLTLLPPVRYYEQSRLKTVEFTARQLLKKVDKKQLLGRDQTDPELWAKESNQILNQFALSSIKPDSRLPKSYISEGQTIAAERIVLSGLRLATLLNQTLKNKNQSENKLPKQ